jgi:hypothetical protein
VPNSQAALAALFTEQQLLGTTFFKENNKWGMNKNLF